MDFAARFRTATSPAVVRLYHADAPDQLTRPNIARALAAAPDHVRSLTMLLDRHGAALARWAPGLLVQYTRGLATQQFLAGDRAAGLQDDQSVDSHASRAVERLGCSGTGAIDRRLLAHAQAQRGR